VPLYTQKGGGGQQLERIGSLIDNNCMAGHRRGKKGSKGAQEF